jgi:5-methylcytosine-specific restriction protein A
MQWRNLRNTYIREYPLCAECERQNKTTLGTVVDHIIPIRIGGDKLSLDNLQTLCTSCHNSKSAKEKT